MKFSKIHWLLKKGTLNQEIYLRLLVPIVLFFVFAFRQENYAPLTEGWWRVYSRWISQGLIPYKDFNLIVPPGMPYIDLFFSKIVGQSFLNLRFVGLALLCVISLLIYEILKKLISQSYAALLAIIGTIILYSTEVVILFDYNYFAIFFLLLATVFWQISENLNLSDKKALFYSSLSGSALGFSLLVKLNFGFFLGIFFLVITIIRLFAKPSANRKYLWLGLISKLFGLIVPISFTCIYFYSHDALSAMFNSLFRESAAAKGNASSALFNWIIYLFDSYSYRKEFAVVVFSILIYFGLEKYLLPKLFFPEIQSFRIRNFYLHKKILNKIYFGFIVVFITLSILYLIVLTRTGTEGWWIVLCKQIAYLIIPHTFLIPVVFIFVILFWAIKKNNQRWIPLVTLCLTLIWGAGTSGGLNWYATAIPFIAIFAWVNNKTQHKDFLTAVSVLVSITIATTTYASWIYSPYNWWGYRTPSVPSAHVVSDTGLTKGLRTDSQTLSTLKSVESDFQKVEGCRGGLLVFPHMPIFQLDLDSQPQRRDAIYWFDFVSQKNIQKAILEIEKNPPAGFAIVNVPRFVWEGHSNAFNGGKNYLQQEFIAALLSESSDGYSSSRYSLYSNTSDWSIKVYTRDSCLTRK